MIRVIGTSSLSRQKFAKTGHHQSPIDIHSGETESLEQDLEIHYHKAPLDVVNNGHTVEFDTKDSHYILLDGQRYNLVQFHFHAHSEHALDGKYFPAEMHLVHKSEEGELVVLAVYQDVAAHHISSHVFDHIPEREKRETVSLDLNILLPSEKDRFVYDGSLTTPPCTENVTWLVFKNPITLSSQDFDRFKAFYSSNFRPVQKEHLRKIYLVSE
jgi:carbonic anhydrase